MKSIRNIIAVAALTVITLAGQSEAQVATVAAGGTAALKTAITVPDISYLTNHAELVGQVFKNVNGVLVSFTPAASTRSGPTVMFVAYTNKVKSLEGISALVTNSWWSMGVVDTNAPISVNVRFLDTSDESTARGWNPEVSAQTLFEGVNGGRPIRNQYGQWVLPDWAEEVQMRISGDIFVTMTNVAYVHLVTKNPYGNYYGTDMEIDYGKGFWFKPDYAGNGTLLIGSYVYATNGIYYYVEHAYSLADNAKEVPINQVLVRALLEDSDDFRTSVDTTNLSYTVYSYNGYGKVPLLTPTYTKAMTVTLSVGDQLGDFSSSYIVEDQATGHRETVHVPDGSTSVTVTLPKGVYHVIPSLSLQSPMYYGWGYYGGGKG